MAWGYWRGCYRPQVGLGVLVWLLQPTGGTGMGATALNIAWEYWPGCYRPQVDLGYWPGCYRPQVGLGVLAWLLQAPDWPGVLAWLLPGLLVCLGILAWLLQPTGVSGQAVTALRIAWGNPGWPGGTGRAATGHRFACGYWPGCCSPQGVQALLLQPSGEPWVLAWLLQPSG